jgi:hypothetical protein
MPVFWGSLPAKAINTGLVTSDTSERSIEEHAIGALPALVPRTVRIRHAKKILEIQDLASRLLSCKSMQMLLLLLL